jgi:phospholipase C
MRIRCWPLIPMLAGLTAAHAQTSLPALDAIHNIVVIFAENRSFDVLYGSFPGANGLNQADPASFTQRDRDGSALKELPPIWRGLTAAGVTPPVTEAQTAHLPNKPFASTTRVVSIHR